ncbi:hypothetical protein AB0M38_30725 [Streptomyces sp. NPDC051742]|uniref:hypothetical protein n=1 Tax=unclassified Streptomyces TaxID=2593676 RepID=UPI003441C34E
MVFEPDAPVAEIDKQAQLVTASGGTVLTRYDSVLKGFSARMTRSHVDAPQAEDAVHYVELNAPTPGM